MQSIEENNFVNVYDRISFNTISSIPRILERVIKNLEYVKSLGCTEDQEKMLELLKSLDQGLKTIKFSAKKTENSLFSFLSTPKLYREVQFLNLEEVSLVLSTINKVQVILQNKSKDPGSIKEYLNFGETVIFGSLDYMRSDIIHKLKAEQV